MSGITLEQVFPEHDPAYWRALDRDGRALCDHRTHRTAQDASRCEEARRRLAVFQDRADP